ncbi:hypothetical protein LSG31_16485 [Fodinisporobacter ferrooxydans]|uniref:RNA-binding protein n=1 Tax=Fodinisporobacter ferrooxydans TaxID=2901836 RepID=A0ABY4CNP1_9BACL|nr:hypothetical protein LSG31_16485 [Alicyclobacillaceae bacterium MYW30-H2]
MQDSGFRSFCNGYVGKQVMVRLKNGTVHQGVLHSITNEGIVLRPANGNQFAAGTAHSNGNIQQAILGESDGTEATQTWWPVWFLIAFALIAGFWGFGAGGWNGYGRPGVYGGSVAPYGGYGGYGRGFMW